MTEHLAVSLSISVEVGDNGCELEIQREGAPPVVLNGELHAGSLASTALTFEKEMNQVRRDMGRLVQPSIDHVSNALLEFHRIGRRYIQKLFRKDIGRL